MNKDMEFRADVKTALREEVLEFISTWNSTQDFFTAATSGSTGNPKTIQIKKRDALISAGATIKFFKLNSSSSLLLSLSPSFIGGKMMIIRSEVCNAKLWVTPAVANPLINGIPSLVDLAAFVPYQFANILADPFSRQELSKVKNVILGGATTSAELEAEIRKLPTRVFATFGMTETVSHFALRNISAGEEHYSCLPGFEVAVDVEYRLCLVKHPFSNDKILTNDVVEVLSPTAFRWLGRYDNVINSGGIKIHPEILERQIEHLIPGHRYYFSSRKHDTLGEVMVLVLEGFNPSDLTELKTEIKSVVPRHHHPETVIIQEKFEETSNGKIIRSKF